MDTIAEREGLTRAHIIREAVQTYLAKHPTSDYMAVVADPETVEWLTATTGLDRLGGATGTRYGLTDLGGGRVHIPASAVEALAEFDDDEDGAIRTVDGRPTMYIEGIDYPLGPADEHRDDDGNETVVWSVVRGASHGARAAEPGLAGIDIPDQVLEWGEEYGLNEDDKVYLLVTPEDEAGEVDGEIAFMSAQAPASRVKALRALVTEQAAE